jgi:hypothetical protein
MEGELVLYSLKGAHWFRAFHGFEQVRVLYNAIQIGWFQQNAGTSADLDRIFIA